MKRFAILCCALLAASGARAQITLDDCRRLAREHYPEIRQYDLIRRTAGYTLSNARRAWLPQVSLSGQATWQTDVPGFPEQMTGLFAGQGIEIPGLRKDQYRVQVEVSQTLWDGGASRADQAVAEAESAVSQGAVDVDLHALEGRVDDLYFGILLLDERIAQTQVTIGLLRSNLDKVRALQRAGVAMPADGDAVEAELLAAGQQLGQVEASRDSYRRMLSIFIGRELADGERLERPAVADPPSGSVARPELRLFDARINRLAAQERQVKASVRPRFGLFAQGNPGSGVWMFILSMIVYGVAFDFFNISGSLFVEQNTDTKQRSSAQGLFMLMTNGIGATIGTLSAQAVVNAYTVDGVTQWAACWYVFAGYALVVAVAFALIFRPKTKKHNEE